MATLTTSWQSFASASYSTGSSTVYFYLEARYTSQSTTNNTTNIQTRLRSDLTSGYISGAGYKFTCSYASTVSGSGVWNFGDEVITSGSGTITHNSDGTKSISLSASAYNKYWNFTKNLSATVTLPKINRIATVTKGTDFNDETNPTITFTNPAKFQLIPYLNFYYNGQILVHLERPKGTYTSPYTWTLTDVEREQIRSTITMTSTINIVEGLETYNGNTKIGASSLTRKFTFINANPTMTYTTTETNTDVSSLLGSSSANTIIQNVSKVEVAVTPTALKSATISKVAVTNSGVTLTDTTSPYELEFDITNNNFSITTTDSRGLTVSDSFTKTLIEYQKVKSNSFSFKRINPTSSNVRLLVDSVYYQQTFGNTANTPTVKYKISSEGTWVTIPSSEYTIDTENNKLTVDYTIANAIDYRNGDTFYVEVSDLLSSWTNSNNISKGIPVMEWGDDEVQINGDLLLADINRDSVINVRDALGGSGGTTDYTLLTNKPQINGNTLTGNMSTSDLGITIPTVNNGKLTIGRNGTKLNDFYANSSSNVSVDISVPVEDVQINGTSILSNKEANIRTNSTYNSSTNKIATMNDIPTVPTKVSDLTNDSGYITGIDSSDVTTALGFTPQEEITSANKLDYSLIDNTPTIGNAKTYYGVCNTGAYVGTKEVTISDFISETGAIVTIKFTYGNEYINTPLLKINNNEAKYLKIASNTLTYKFGVNSTKSFVYDGSDFILIEPSPANSSNYGLVKTSTSVSSTSTTDVATSSAVKQAYDLANGKQDAITSSNKLDYSLISNTPTIPSKTSDLTNDSNFVDTSYHDSTKQDTLVSGTNIKTINNTSLLGSGNINISGGGTATDVQINGTSITSGGTANILTNGTYSSSNKIATMSDIPTVPSNVSAFTNDAGYLTSYTETDPVFSASASAGITSTDISSWNGKAEISDIPTPNIMSVYLASDYTIPNTNTTYDLTNMAVASSTGSKLTFSNGKIVIGAGVSKVKVSYTLKVISNANATRTFTYLMSDVNGTATALSQEGYWYGGTNWQVVNTYGPRVINVNQGDTFYLRCYGYKNNTIAGATSTFMPTILTVEVIG